MGSLRYVPPAHAYAKLAFAIADFLITLGISAVMFAVTLSTLFHKAPVNKPMVYVSCIFFLVSTTVSLMLYLNVIGLAIFFFSQHAILDLVRLYQGFILSTVAVGGSNGFFADVATSVFVTKSALYMITTLLGDGVVVCTSVSHTRSTRQLTS
jgi:hypothetical protein